MKNVGLERTAARAVLLLFAAAAICTNGCKKKEKPAEEKAGTGGIKLPPVNAVQNPDSIARVHWIGKKRVTGDPNSANLMSIWRMPETEKVIAQTLDKLAIALWRPWTTNSQAITNYSAVISNLAPAALLRPLLDDLVQEEWHLGIRKTDSNSAEIALAVKLAPDRADAWKSALTKMTSDRLWPFAGFVETERSGGWTLVGFAKSTEPPNPVLAEFRAHAGDGTLSPAPVAGRTSPWLEADFDLKEFSTAFSLGWKLPQNCPSVSLSVNGEAGNVHTRARWNFPQPLNLTLDPWTIPTNIVHDPLSSFTAVRGIGSWLGSLKQWTDLAAGPAPNQIYLWSQGSAPILSYIAAALPDPGNAVRHCTDLLMQKANPYVTTNGMGSLEPRDNGPGVHWTGVPFCAPFMDSTTTNGRGFMLAGLNPLSGNTNLTMPASLITQFTGRTNLVYYDWEITGPRVQSLLYVSQLFRLVFEKAQFSTNEPTVVFIRAAEPLLGNCATMGLQTSPNQITFSRTSTIGLSALEIHLLSDWLESPHFPQGLHTLLVEAPKQKPRKRQPRPAGQPGSATNAAPAPAAPPPGPTPGPQANPPPPGNP